MENVYYNSYTEIYEILSYMPINYIKKLPKELLNLFDEKRNKDYKYRINTDKNINEQEMSIETKSILSNLYRDFWSSPEKKDEILQKEKIERDEYEKELREKYNPDNLFKNRHQTIDEKAQAEILPVPLEKVSVIQKIFSYIKSLFKK